jgi:hypothetical protein
MFLSHIILPNKNLFPPPILTVRRNTCPTLFPPFHLNGTTLFSAISVASISLDPRTGDSSSQTYPCPLVITPKSSPQLKASSNSISIVSEYGESTREQK